MNANQALWEKGDFTQIAATMRGSGEAIVRDLGVTSGMSVLDLGCGDGTTAIPSAQLGAEVTGIDISVPLVEAGRRRAQELGLENIHFEHGDAMDLGELEDASFDLTMSIFGAMFAPRPFDVAREVTRVTKPGGRIVMGNWIPGDPTMVAQLLKISASYAPPPPEGFVSPVLWGVEDNVVERFTAAGIPAHDIAFQRDLWTFDFPGSPAEYVAAFRDYYGPTMNAFDAARAAGREQDLQSELEALFEEHNTASEGTKISAAYLRVTVSR
jgi:SAM-dependent methyltransferase